MLFHRGKASNTGDDEFAMDRKDGIKRPEVKRVALESVEAVEKELEKSHRIPILPVPKNDKDEFTMDRMDGIKRPEVKKKALEGVEALEKDRDYGMFQTERIPLPRRKSARRSVVLEEGMSGEFLKNQTVSRKELEDLYQQSAFDALDGVRSKRKSCSRDMKEDLAFVKAVVTEDESLLPGSSNDGERSYGEIIVDASGMDISGITTRTTESVSNR